MSSSLLSHRLPLASMVLPSRTARQPRLMCSCSVAAPSLAFPSTNGNGNGSISIASPSSPPAITVNVPEPKPAVTPPALTFKAVAAVGKAKVSLPSPKVFTIGVLAGIYIAFGCFFMIAVGGNMPGIAASNPGLHKLIFSLVFPVGLLMVILNAPELYTGNTAITTSAALEGEMSFGELLRNWFLSYSGNFVGSLLMVAMITASGALAGNAMAVNTAVAKTSLPFATAFFRAILANWLVCVAVFHATSASSLPGKVLGIWLPITSFVVMGLEHSVANMFTIPMGIALGANVTFTDFLLKNLLPVTLGNTLAGVLMATMAAVSYGALGNKLFGAKAV